MPKSGDPAKRARAIVQAVRIEICCSISLFFLLALNSHVETGYTLQQPKNPRRGQSHSRFLDDCRVDIPSRFRRTSVQLWSV